MSLSEIEAKAKADLAILEGLPGRLDAIFQVHFRAAQSEGRVLEGHIMALVKDLIMTSVADIQAGMKTLSDKFSQVEADVGALVAKAGGSGAPPADALSLTQDQADAIGSTITNLSTRMDTLVQNVVAGTTPPPTTTPPSTPSTPSTPAPSSDTPVTTTTTPPVSSSSPAPAAPSGSPSATGTAAPAPGQ